MRNIWRVLFFVGKNPYLGVKTVLKVEGPNYVRIRRCTVEYVAGILFKIFKGVMQK